MDKIQDNGWNQYIDGNSVDVYMCEGEHDTMLRIESLAPYRDQIYSFCEQLLSLEKQGNNCLNLT